MDTPSQKFLKIGTTSVGLIGLDPALQKAMADKLSPQAAEEFLFATIAKLNYVPATAHDNYRKALRQEYERRITGQAFTSDVLEVRIFASGCVTCDKLASTMFDILQRMNLVADIEKIYDLDEIWRHGVITPPALKINGELLCQGRMPTPAEIEQWLRDRQQ
ncbi:MAG: thioredoxin family protein [Proteobacteria bacterium]|nr:thioredoxin family protein [Pseudomonadota bacterium]MBU1640987.1 thioredoxin family protein [Pseudomonadota bacterium]